LLHQPDIHEGVNGTPLPGASPTLITVQSDEISRGLLEGLRFIALDDLLFDLVAPALSAPQQACRVLLILHKYLEVTRNKRSHREMISISSSRTIGGGSTSLYCSRSFSRRATSAS
jgi:hypothetical protein